MTIRSSPRRAPARRWSSTTTRACSATIRNGSRRRSGRGSGSTSSRSSWSTWSKAHEAGLRGKGTVTYHASCHLTRSLGVREEPLTLLSSLKGATFLPMPDAARCCGFGGTFMAKLPEISCALADEKAASIEATGADTVTGCDSGCLMNIADAMRRRGTKIRVAHIAQLLAEGL